MGILIAIGLSVVLFIINFYLIMNLRSLLEKEEEKRLQNQSLINSARTEWINNRSMDKQNSEEIIKKFNTKMDNFDTRIKAIDSHTKELEWKIQNPAPYKVGSKYKKDYIVTNISIVEASPELLEFARYFRQVLPSALAPNETPNGTIAEKNRALNFAWLIKATHTKTGEVIHHTL